jgi:uncharacterized protein (DUF488 family)
MSNPPVARTVWSIGHSNHSLAALLELLRRGDVEVVADLRSFPRSRFNPQFDRRSFEPELMANGVGYLWLGDDLGGRPAEPELHDRDGKVDYAAVATTERFHVGIDRLLDLAAGARVAMMCSEADPTACHRRVLVTPELVRRGVTVIHLLADGTATTEEDLAATIEAARPPTLF